MQVITKEGHRPVRVWTDDVDDKSLAQLENIASLPFIHRHGVAAMPDVHLGKGATVGSVIATTTAIIPAAVGVDLGCGMVAARLSLTASDLPDSLTALRHQIERDIPMGAGGRYTRHADLTRLAEIFPEDVPASVAVSMAGRRGAEGENHEDLAYAKALSQLGTLGSGNHFIELCLDEQDRAWLMLHSGSRGIGNIVGSYYIERAKRQMERYFITLPDKDLAYLPEDTQDFKDYVEAVGWAQDYAARNREVMMTAVIDALRLHIDQPFTLEGEMTNCHHNYIARENHFGENLWVTRKGAIRAREGDYGIIPGSMGAKSFIVRGKGSQDSYASCSHGAGRAMSRSEAKRRFTAQDLADQTEGIECRKDAAVVDEIPSAYKDIDTVMANQADLVEVVHTLKQVMSVKGG